MTASLLVDAAGTVSFDVHGIPAPQGSKRHVGNGVLVESSAALPAWRDSVAMTARVAAARGQVRAPLDGPLHLDVEFRFPMPKSRTVAIRAEGCVPKTTQPDLDKLVRAVGDALTDSGLIADDARITGLSARKLEVVGWTGAVIRIGPT